MIYSFASVAARPELAPMVAEWLLDEFGHARSPTHAQLVAMIVAQPASSEDSFVLFADDVPVGTASLVNSDLKARPDLQPWLASVLVRPQFRGRGYSPMLVRHVEERAAAAGVSTLWLYTWSADRLYARLGWQRVGIERDTDRDVEVVLMKRDLVA
jgi:predicted N-acetyltransferase YhbS